MGRRLLFVLGLIFAAAGGWIVHHEGAINNACNAQITNPSRGFMVSASCLNIVWPYSEGFALMLLGAVFVFAGLMLTRRAMAGERQYMKRLKAGRYDSENNHRNADHFNSQFPDRIGATPQADQGEFPPET
ncbi:MAG: hypothetical protein HIU57_04480 [Acidobacteria bacterium]|nr:hypothetical protein [Acidobacteriota bacterium]